MLVNRHIGIGVVVLSVLAAASGCSVTREQQLRAKAAAVESALVSERGRTLTMGDAASRASKLDHLTSLRTQLSLVNVARGSAPHFLEHPQLDAAYDVIEEAYGTIEWNIPMLPGQALRPLPSQFTSQGLNFNAFTSPQGR